MPPDGLFQLATGGAVLDLRDVFGALGFSLLASVVTLAMYNAFYGSSHIGAGVQRFFLLGGPAITGLFLAIQFSLPLSLGLLGALSIVRFRTPVKDPAEIGFILLLVAASIGSATFNYLLVLVLYVLAFGVLFVQRAAQRYVVGLGRSYLMVTLGGDGERHQEAEVTSFISRTFRNARLESLSTLDGKTSMHFQFSRPKEFDWGAFTNELKQVTGSDATVIHMN